MAPAPPEAASGPEACARAGEATEAGARAGEASARVGELDAEAAEAVLVEPEVSARRLATNWACWVRTTAQ